MPLKKSSSEEAFEDNLGEMIASSKQKGTKMGKARQKFGPKKTRQMALAAAFSIKEQSRKGK